MVLKFVFRSAPKSLFVPLLVFGRPQVVDVVDSKLLVNHADTRADGLVEEVELVRNVVVAFRALPRPIGRGVSRRAGPGQP